MGWNILAEPQGANSGASPESAENTGGVVVYLIEGSDRSTRQEVSRVAYDRSKSKNPRTTFDTQLTKELAKAVTACQKINDLMGDGELQ